MASKEPSIFGGRNENQKLFSNSTHWRPWGPTDACSRLFPGKDHFASTEENRSGSLIVHCSAALSTRWLGRLWGWATVPVPWLRREQSLGAEGLREACQPGSQGLQTLPGGLHACSGTSKAYAPTFFFWKEIDKSELCWHFSPSHSYLLGRAFCHWITWGQGFSGFVQLKVLAGLVSATY